MLHAARCTRLPERSYTPLHYASVNGHFECARLLLDLGASANAGNCHG
jgi:ankyrin repeat protein